MKTTAEMLRELVEETGRTSEEEDEPRWASSMADMWSRYTNGRLSTFSGKQAAYIRETHEKVFDEPTYSNDFSAGKVALGEALRTPIPDVLKGPLPKKPPGRL